ncbi:family 16 glycosylhydrolase [Allobranchiibius sp. GilTou38]|uniref:family 16 glycosylhydrolase n=1 Tax=Allobranchiibius sp. GilTou38 TaxID=2815210 RepID=UPI001AA0C60D|nr:family 16 glycosylhydrolase [Allobranchiibius sp. GilTou38]MBO1766926.1 family 16 glycosylhydrolase [Allobranchiibius sp. GilTou38]
MKRRIVAVSVALTLSTATAVTLPAHAATTTNYYRRLVANLEFNRGNVPAGSRWNPTDNSGDLPSSNPYASTMTTYPSGWGTPAQGYYHPERTMSVANGVLTIRALGSQGTEWGGSVLPIATDNKVGSRRYGRIEYRLRATGAAGHSFAAFEWPSDDNWVYEMNATEGFETPGTTVGGTYHYNGAAGQQGFTARQHQQTSNWHTFQINWWPGGQSVWIDRRYLEYDDAAAGHLAPTQIMRFLLQTNKAWNGTPANGSTGTVQLAYVKEWAYNN